MGKRRSADSGPSSRLIKGAGFLIGLATELHAHNKAKKSGSQSTQDQSQQTLTLQHKTRSRIDDGPPAYDEARTAEPLPNSDTAMTDMNSTYIEKPLIGHSLPYPVILPQRRPNDKSRGFVRAYAPDLGRYKGIDEPTFLGFLKDFHKSSQASGIFQIINIAALGAGFAPSLIATAVSISVKTASRAAEEAHSRYRTNSYLDKANKDLFHPRNLHCMIMTFKAEVGENALLNFNVNSGSMTGAPALLGRLTGDVSGASGKGGRVFRASDGVTDGELAMPQAAHLVYPSPTQSETSWSGLDGDKDSTTAGKKGQQSSWKSTSKFLSEYKDRRAQAKFAALHGPDSKLAVPGASDPARFASKFSDPNHSINSGNPLGILAGERPGSHGDRRGRVREGRRKSASRDRRQSKELSHGLFGGVKNMMQQDVLYLLVAEIPSEHEMDIFTSEM